MIFVRLGSPRSRPFLPYTTTANFLGLDVLFGWIWTGLEWVAEKAAIIAVAVGQAVAKAASYTWEGLKWLGGKIKDGALWLKDRVVDFGKWWKEKAGPWLQKTFTGIQNWLTAHFGWLTKWVKWVQKNLGWVYTRILRPILHVIDVVRTVLRLLADMGVKWAADAERWLAKVEFKLVGFYNELLGFVNEIAGIVDLIFNPNGFFRRDIFMWTHWHLASDIAAVFRLARIDRDPVAEAHVLISGFPGPDNKSQAQALLADLFEPPREIVDAAIELERELGLG